MSTEVKAFLLFLIEFSFMMIIGVFNIVIWLTLSGVVKVIEKTHKWISDRLGVD